MLRPHISARRLHVRVFVRLNWLWEGAWVITLWWSLLHTPKERAFTELPHTIRKKKTILELKIELLVLLFVIPRRSQNQFKDVLSLTDLSRVKTYGLDSNSSCGAENPLKNDRFSLFYFLISSTRITTAQKITNTQLFALVFIPTHFTGCHDLHTGCDPRCTWCSQYCNQFQI